MADSKTKKQSPRNASLADVVAEKQPVLHPEESVQEAGDKMREMEVETLPVLEGRRLVGIVDQPDPDRRAAGHGHDPKATAVSEYMNRDAPYCFEDDACTTALRKMDERQLDRLPVVDREMRIVGIVTRAELVERSQGGVDLKKGKSD